MVSSKPDLDDVVASALREDLGGETRDVDVTTHFVVDSDLLGEARIIAKSQGVLSGGLAAARVFEMVHPPCEYIALLPDGARMEAGD
jgi:nicotinate-nucleotide pyrophosphorylase (carboxylating)